MKKNRGFRNGGYSVNPLYFPSFVDEIRETRLQKKLSYEAIQKATGVSMAYVNKMELNQLLPSPEKCLKVAHYLGLDIEKVLYELYDYWLHSLHDEFGEYCKIYHVKPPFSQNKT